MTAHDTLLRLLGEWVTVTHPGDEHRVWHGQLASMMDSPSIVLRMPEGGTEVLPQSFIVQAAAPATSRPYPDPDAHARPFAELIDSGLLWHLNRYSLHPRGLALALHVDEHGQAYGWSLIHNSNGEPWQYDQATDNDGRTRAEATIAAELADVRPDDPLCIACGGAPAVWEIPDGRKFCAGCISCECGRDDCALTNPPTPATPGPDTPSGHPDPGSGQGIRTGGYVRMPPGIGETTAALTMPDTIRTSHPDTASGHPDTGSAEVDRGSVKTAIAQALEVPADLLEDTPCSCGQRSPLVLVNPDGGHWHMDPAEHEKLERTKLFGPRDDLHPATVAWSQCWDRAEGLRTRLAYARQVLVEDGYFTDDEVGDDIAPRLVEWLSAHRARTDRLETLVVDMLSTFTDTTVTDGVPAVHSEVRPQQMTEWARTLQRIRTDKPRYTEQCARPECAAARGDLALAAGAYDVVRTTLTTARKYVTQQQQAGFPLRGGDNRYRILSFLAAWTADPGALKLRTRPGAVRTSSASRCITIDAPDGATVRAARHLDASEGPVQTGYTVDAATRSAIDRVLDYIAMAHNAPATTPELS